MSAFEEHCVCAICDGPLRQDGYRIYCRRNRVHFGTKLGDPNRYDKGYGWPTVFDGLKVALGIMAWYWYVRIKYSFIPYPGPRTYE